MGARVAIVLLGVLAAGLPASAKELQVRRPVAVTAVPRLVYRPVPARPAPQTFSMPVFPMAVAPLPAPTGAVRLPRNRARVKAAKGTEDAPKADASKADVQKADAPKADAPKADVQKIDPSKADPSKADAPKADVQKIDASKSDAPKANAPKADGQKADGQKASSAAGAYAAMPESERLAIQSDLALLGDYEGAPGNFDEGTTAAVKAFQQHLHNRATGVLAAPERDALAAAAKGPAAAVGWRLIDDPKTGARLGLPEKLVPNSSASRSGSRWTSAQGQIQIETFRYTEAALPALFEDEKKTSKRRVTASVLRAGFLRHFRRPAAEEFHCPRAGERQRSARRHHPLRSSDRRHHGDSRDRDRRRVSGLSRCQGRAAAGNAARGRIRRRRSWSARAAIFWRRRRATEECRAIVVPGLGHAERVAADTANDLALLRLYGARNLVPAALAGEQQGRCPDALSVSPIRWPRPGTPR